MLNVIWPIFIVISYIYAIFTGKVNEINSSVFESCESAVKLTITFLGTMCLWSGIMQIAQKTTLIDKLTNILTPIMKILFPKIQKGSKAHKEISMNMVANILGLGNASTPLGLKAMKTLQKENRKKRYTNKRNGNVHNNKHSINTTNSNNSNSNKKFIRLTKPNRNNNTSMDSNNMCCNSRNNISKDINEEILTEGRNNPIILYSNLIIGLYRVRYEHN